MKIKEFMSEIGDAPDDQCSICWLHEEFAKRHPHDVVCPQCRTVMSPLIVHDPDLLVVGETNGANAEEEIRIYPAVRCDQCYELVALVPTSIIWNANHDIYYTGGRSFIPGDAPEKINALLRDRIEPLITEYTDRVRAGGLLGNVAPVNLVTWLEGALEAAVAEYLFRLGLKP